MDGLRDIAKQQAREVRDAVRSLPMRPMDMSSLDGGANVVREQAERMADALELVALSGAE